MFAVVVEFARAYKRTTIKLIRWHLSCKLSCPIVPAWRDARGRAEKRRH